MVCAWGLREGRYGGRSVEPVYLLIRIETHLPLFHFHDELRFEESGRRRKQLQTRYELCVGCLLGETTLKGPFIRCDGQISEGCLISLLKLTPALTQLELPPLVALAGLKVSDFDGHDITSVRLGSDINSAIKSAYLCPC